MIAVAVAVLALGVVAISGAAADEDDGLVGSFLAKVAEKLGVSEDELKTAIDEARDETIDEAVDEGRLTEEQGERLREGNFFFRGLHGGIWRAHFDVMKNAADVLGMTRADLMEQLADGNSLAELAEAQGMSVDDFKAALLDKIKAQLDEMVSDGDLTQDQADDFYQHTEGMIDGIVNAEGCFHAFGSMRGGPRGFGGMWFAPFSDHDEESETTETSDVTA